MYREIEIQLFLYYPNPYPAISNVTVNGPQCSFSGREHPWSLRRAPAVRLGHVTKLLLIRYEQK